MTKQKPCRPKRVLRPDPCPWCGRRPLIEYCRGIEMYEAKCFAGCPVELRMVLGSSKRQGILNWNRQKRNRYELDERQRIRNLALLVVRLSRRLPEENEARRAALDFLVREGIMPSVLREEP